jgi:Flp pilus assembly protein CpaB
VLTATAILLARSRIEAARLEVLDSAKPTEIVVASRPIRAGDAFSAENLAKKAIPLSGTGKRNVPASDFGLLLGARSKGEIGSGEPVLWTDVEEPFEFDGFSLAVEPGRRALTLEAGATDSFSGLVRTGDRVDLLCNPSRLWIRGIEVLAVDRHYNRSGAREQDEVSTLTLSVTADEGRQLAECRQDGSLTWFLRNPADNAVSQAGVKTIRPTRVEIWKGGIPQAFDFPAGAFR